MPLPAELQKLTADFQVGVNQYRAGDLGLARETFKPIFEYAQLDDSRREYFARLFDDSRVNIDDFAEPIPEVVPVKITYVEPPSTPQVVAEGAAFTAGFAGAARAGYNREDGVLAGSGGAAAVAAASVLRKRRSKALSKQAEKALAASQDRITRENV